MTRICCASHSDQHCAHTRCSISSPIVPGSTRPAPSRVSPQRTHVTSAMSAPHSTGACERPVTERRAPDDIGERHVAEVPAVGRVIATITHNGDLIVAHGGHALQEQMRRVAWIANDDDIADAGLPARREHEEPIPLPQRRLHAVAGDGHTPRTSPHFFVAQNMSLISFTAVCSSAAAAASTFCLFFEQSFAAFQNVSCNFGYFSRCSGLK